MSLINLLSSISTVDKTADLLRAVLQEHQHGFSPELAPVSDGSWTEVLLSDNGGRYATHHVCEEHNPVESEVTLLKP